MHSLSSEKKWMYHALRLASYAEGSTAPNPMVGAVLVWDNMIIGEGFHIVYGGPHAEVNCIHSVKKEYLDKIPESTLYVTLEPCNHFGKTPPCVDIILEYKIPKVVIACRDPFSKVDGTGIARLKEAGIDVVLDVLKEEARYINRKFFYFHEHKLPFITLKWASSIDGKMGSGSMKRALISNQYSQRWVHRLRTVHQAILIGVNTANLDQPSLDTRYWSHKNPPIKIILDEAGNINSDLSLLKQGSKTIIFTRNEHLEKKFSEVINVTIIQIPKGEDLRWILHKLYELEIQSVLVEGGSNVLQQFINLGLWQEAIQIIGNKADVENRIQGPLIDHQYFINQSKLNSDTLLFFNNKF